MLQATIIFNLCDYIIYYKKIFFTSPIDAFVKSCHIKSFRLFYFYIIYIYIYINDLTSKDYKFIQIIMLFKLK